jgi:hypothetical protein
MILNLMLPVASNKQCVGRIRLEIVNLKHGI